MKQQIQSPAAAVLLLNGRGELESDPEKDNVLDGASSFGGTRAIQMVSE